MDFLSNAFEEIKDVPYELVIDKAKTMMDKPRTANSKGKTNNKFQQFADDYKIKVQPCIAYRPETKAKVENRMKITVKN